MLNAYITGAPCTMELLHKFENKMADIYKGVPQLPQNARDTLVEIWPWIALVFGVVQVFAAWGLWRLIHVISALDEWARTVGNYYGHYAYNAGPSMFDKTMVYVGILVLLVDALILLLAFPKLKLRQRAGWDLLFLSALANVAYGVVQIFIDGRGVGSFIFSIIETGVVFYFLLQVRDRYGVGITPPVTPTEPTVTPTIPEAPKEPEEGAKPRHNVAAETKTEHETTSHSAPHSHSAKKESKPKSKD